MNQWLGPAIFTDAPLGHWRFYNDKEVKEC